MEFTADKDYLLDVFTRLIGCDSPVGYYREMEPLMTSLVAELGYHAFRDRKHTVYVRVGGGATAPAPCAWAPTSTPSRWAFAPSRRTAPCAVATSGA